jgi:hypothetical protein
VRSGAEVSKYETERGWVERFSLCQRGRKERPVFRQAVVAFLREQKVPTEELRRMAWQVLGKIWYRPRLLWRFLREQPPHDNIGET